MAGGGLLHSGRGGWSVRGAPPAHRGKHCDALAAGYHGDVQGCGGGTGTCPSGAGCTVAGIWALVGLSFRLRGRHEVHLLLRVPLVAVLLSSSSSMGLAGRVVPVWVGHQRGVRLLLGFGPGHSPAAGGVLLGQFHACVILGGLDSDNREFGLVVEPLVRDGRQAGAKFIAEDASEEPRVHFPRWGIVDLLPSDPQSLGEGLRVHFLGRVPLLLGRALCLVGGCGFGWGGSWAVRDLLDRGRAGEEGARDLRDTMQAGRVAEDPGPRIPNRGLREDADARAAVAEQLEVEGVRNLVFAALGDFWDPFQEGSQCGVGGRGHGRRRLGSSARGPGGSSCPGLGNRGQDGERQLGGTHGGLRGRPGACRSHSPSEDVGQVLEVRHLGRGEDCRAKDDGHEDQELLRAGRRQLKRG